MERNLTVSKLIEKISELKVGDSILLSGTIYTARDAAHKRLVEIIEKKQVLPFDLKNSVIYYCGPCPAKPGEIIGSCGPTTSNRMDKYTPLLLSLGLKATIGKGPRSDEVVYAMKKNSAVYLAATGGIGALLSKKVKSSQIIAFEDLGTEAIHKLEVIDFPVIVANDVNGNNIFEG
ncbi:MAG: Fe-S-containing hydro-lyase [Elusimicrobia bacterium]|nr:Fe-S-containing hydro-lyase [Candidatus Liberimonas magnetica]